MSQQMQTNTHQPLPLASEGLYRWTEFSDRLPVSRETWRLRVLAKTAPEPLRIGQRCTVWRGADILKWLADPNGYDAADESK